MGAAKSKQHTITNEQAFDRYRRIVEGDLRQEVVSYNSSGEFGATLHLLSVWGGRYRRRCDILEGAGSGERLTDAIACRLLLERNRRIDEQCRDLPEWEASTRSIIDMGLQNSYRTSLGEPHAYGPSLRRLWADAKQRGISNADAGTHVIEWARRLPPAFARDVKRLRRKEPPLGAEHGRLERALQWSSTGDLTLPWQAIVDGAQWRVRLNDFPDEFMYTLLVDGREIGDFHDWPGAWAREGQPAAAPAAAPAPKRSAGPAIGIEAAARWLQRYANGECEKVWAEMRSLGPDVRGKGHFEPAQAVAAETMRRARHNVELLIRRLDGLGYGFYRPGPPPGLDEATMLVRTGDGFAARSPADLLREATQADYSRLPPQLREQLEGRRRAMLDMIEAQRASVETLQAKQAERPASISDRLKDPDVFVAPPRGTARRLAKLERKGIVLPLSLAAWMAEVGRVDLVGSHPTLCFMDGIGGADAAKILADPLSIIPMAEEVEEAAGDWEESDGDGSIPLFIGFRDSDKAALAAGDAQIDDGYTIAIPDASADAVLEGESHGITFVEYLRLAFRFGGFAGWERYENRPQKELSMLTEGLAAL